MSEDPKDAPEFAKYAASPAAFGQISAPGSSSPSQTLLDFARELETWALMNEQDAHSDTLKFWALKIPAIAASSCAGLFASFNHGKVSVVAGAIGSVCILLDGLLRAGMLRNVHIRAFHDLRDLQSEITRQWQIGCFEKKDENLLAAQVLQKAMEQRAQIQAYLKAAESSLLETQIK